MGAVRAVQHRQEHIVIGVIAHQFLDVPPGGNAQIALCALSQQLVGILTEHLHVHQTLGVPVVEVGDRLAVVVLGADKAALAVLLQHQIVAHIVGPVGESEACVEDVLTPAPLVKASGHRDGAAGCITVDLGGHIVVLEGLQGGVQLVQRGRHCQPQLVQPALVDHGELRNGEDAVILVVTDTGSAHLLGSGQTVDAAVAHGDSGADVGMLVQDLGQVGHDLGVDIGGQVQERAVCTVVGDIVVGEAHTHKGVRQLVACNADVHLLAEGVAHGLVVEFNAHVICQLLQHLVVVVAGAQSRLTAHDVKAGLVGVGGVRSSGLFAAAAGRQCHGRTGNGANLQEIAARDHLFHGCSPFL